MDDSAETMREIVMKLITTSCIKQLAVLMLCSTIGEAFSSSGAGCAIGRGPCCSPCGAPDWPGGPMSGDFRAQGRLSQLSGRSRHCGRNRRGFALSGPPRSQRRRPACCDPRRRCSSRLSNQVGSFAGRTPTIAYRLRCHDVSHGGRHIGRACEPFVSVFAQ